MKCGDKLKTSQCSQANTVNLKKLKEGIKCIKSKSVVKICAREKSMKTLVDLRGEI